MGRRYIFCVNFTFWSLLKPAIPRGIAYSYGPWAPSEVMLVCTPLGLASQSLGWDQVTTFVLCFLAIVPLAKLLLGRMEVPLKPWDLPTIPYHYWHRYSFIAPVNRLAAFSSRLAIVDHGRREKCGKMWLEFVHIIGPQSYWTEEVSSRTAEVSNAGSSEKTIDNLRRQIHLTDLS